MIYIAVPENISKSKKISALYFQYSLTEFNDKNLLENIIKQLNINIKNSTKDKTDFLYKEIFKMWLQGMGYEKSLLSMNKFDDAVPKQIVDKTISTYQIIKALNQEWMHVCLDTICEQITNKKIAKILTESLEDYVDLWNSDYEDVKKHSKVDSKGLVKLLENFKIRLEELHVGEGKQKNMLKEKKSSASFASYSTLIERVDNLRRQI